MHDHYIRISDDAPKNQNPRLLLLGYISQLILYIMIIIYCILSPSLFSTISLMFMLVSFALMIATPYYVQKRTESERSIRVYAHPVERGVWGIFMGFNVAVFAFKLAMQLTGIYDDASVKLQ